MFSHNSSKTGHFLNVANFTYIHNSAGHTSVGDGWLVLPQFLADRLSSLYRLQMLVQDDMANVTPKACGFTKVFNCCEAHFHKEKFLSS